MPKEIVSIETSKGKIVVELNREKAPVSVANFLNYVRERAYDGTVFHRVIPGFMIQGGGYLPDGSEVPTHSPIKLESGNGLKNLEGTIAMARTSVPDSATNQFFINVANNAFLDQTAGNDGYAVFGKVIEGLGTVHSIEAEPTGVRAGMEDWPREDVVIKSIRLI